MEHYTADVEVARRDDLTDDDLDTIMDSLAEYAAAVGATPRGHLTARVTFPAASISQAATTAAAVVGAAFGSKVIRIDIMTEAEADLREGTVEVPQLLGVPEAAELLGVTPQRVRQMIAEGKIAAHRVGERSFALTRSEVEAKASAA